MNGINFGLKLWSKNYNLLGEAKRLIEKRIFHYIELMVLPDSNIVHFQKIKVPYIIHIPSENWGVNIADKNKEKFNLEAISECMKWADLLGAKYLVLHPGFGEIERAKNFLKKIKDSRILIENVPKVGINNEKMIGYTPEQIKTLMGSKFGFCLDLNHAIKAATSLKEDYQDYIKDFLKLKPKMFHIADGTLKEEKDEHLAIGSGGYDFRFLISCLDKDTYLTLETPRNNLNSFREDLGNLQKLKEFLLPRI